MAGVSVRVDVGVGFCVDVCAGSFVEVCYQLLFPCNDSPSALAEKRSAPLVVLASPVVFPSVSASQPPAQSVESQPGYLPQLEPAYCVQGQG